MVSVSPEVDQLSSVKGAQPGSMRGGEEEGEGGEEEAEEEEVQEVPPWARAEKPFRSKKEAIATFYDSLPKLSLTRGALRELNRRNQKARLAPPATPVCSPDRNKRVTALDSSPEVRRFARHGGPDLRDLRGV